MFSRAWLAGGIPRTACVAAYEPICAVSLADSYINRANPGTYDAAPGTAPTWAAETGWTFNGATQWLNTGLNQADGMSAIVRVSNVAQSPTVGVILGWRGDPRFYLWTSSEFWNYGEAAKGGAQLNVLGTGTQIAAVTPGFSYLNGAQVAAWTYSWTGSTYGTIGIGALNRTGAANLFYTGNVQAVYIYNAPITPTQVRAVTDAMNMLPMRPQLPRFRSWLTGGATLTQFRKLLGLRTGSRGVSE